jgi:hypothetical protein
VVDGPEDVTDLLAPRNHNLPHTVPAAGFTTNPMPRAPSRAPELQEAVDELSASLYGRTLADAQSAQICVDCGASVALSATEYGISGLCQKCQDKIFEVPEVTVRDESVCALCVNDCTQCNIFQE